MNIKYKELEITLKRIENMKKLEIKIFEELTNTVSLIASIINSVIQGKNKAGHTDYQKTKEDKIQKKKNNQRRQSYKEKPIRVRATLTS
jgi:hypothetical protein